MYQQNFHTPDLQKQRVLEIVKAYFCKPVVLLTAIISLVGVVVPIFSAFFYEPTYYDNYSYSSDYWNKVSTSQQISTVEFNLYVQIVILLLFFSIPNILKVIGLFSAFFKSRTRSSTPQSGLTLFFVGNMIYMIIFILSMAPFAFMIVPMIIMLISSFAVPSEGNALFSIILISLCTIVVLFLLHYIGSTRFSMNVRNGLKSGMLSTKGCSLLGTVSIILAVLTGFYTATSLILPIILDEKVFEEYPIVPFDWSSAESFMIIASLILTIILFILYAVIAFGYKKHVSDVLDNEPAFARPVPVFVQVIPPPYHPYVQSPYHPQGPPPPPPQHFYNQPFNNPTPPNNPPFVPQQQTPSTVQSDSKEPTGFAQEEAEKEKVLLEKDSADSILAEENKSQ